jgi:hypothetical protein
MEDLTKKYEFQRILQDAAQYRVLRRVFESLPADECDRNTITELRSLLDECAQAV